MDIASTSAERAETDHPVQVGTPLLSAGVESAFDETTVSAAEVTFRPGERTKLHAHAGVPEGYEATDNREAVEAVVKPDE